LNPLPREGGALQGRAGEGELELEESKVLKRVTQLGLYSPIENIPRSIRSMELKPSPSWQLSSHLMAKKTRQGVRKGETKFDTAWWLDAGEQGGKINVVKKYKDETVMRNGPGVLLLQRLLLLDPLPMAEGRGRTAG